MEALSTAYAKKKGLGLSTPQTKCGKWSWTEVFIMEKDMNYII